MKQVIVFGNDHTNSIGVIQSLGIAGYRAIGLLYGHNTGLVRNSIFVDKIISAKDAQSCIDKLLNDFQPKGNKIPIIACCDLAALTLEKIKISCKNTIYLSMLQIILLNIWPKKKIKYI